MRLLRELEVVVDEMEMEVGGTSVVSWFVVPEARVRASQRGSENRGKENEEGPYIPAPGGAFARLFVAFEVLGLV